MNTDYYLADDVEARIRMSAPFPCRLCTHLLVKVSALLDRPVCRCQRANALIERLQRGARGADRTGRRGRWPAPGPGQAPRHVPRVRPTGRPRRSAGPGRSR